jgi:hypothetical protein
MFSKDVVMGRALMMRVEVFEDKSVTHITMTGFCPMETGTSMINGVRSEIVGTVEGTVVGGRFVGIIPQILHPEIERAIHEGVSFIRTSKKTAK